MPVSVSNLPVAVNSFYGKADKKRYTTPI